jgi:NTE family protein
LILRKHRTKKYIFPTLVISLFFFSSCAHYKINEPLKDATRNSLYSFGHFSRQPDADETFVILTFSGGGTRAAAFSFGVLEGLKETPLPGTDKTLLEEVDVISTVSGGSFTGAYYALYGPQIFDDFRERFLYRDIQMELVYKLLNPINLFHLSSPYYSRIDLASELYDKTIFGSGTMQKLAEKGKRPFLIINATNLYTGSRFEFTGDQFNYISSDILSYPIAQAVTASSAFPFLLSPIGLVNYSSSDNFKITKADEMALKDYWNNKERYYNALNNTMYSDKEEHPYLYLMDGGLADNIGLRAVHDLYIRGGIRQKINNGTIKRLLIVVVNAKTEAHQTFDRNESPPGLATVALKTCTVSMDNYSFETVESIKQLFSDRIKAQNNIEACRQKLEEHCKNGFKIPELAGGNMKLYVVDISFDNLTDNDEKAFLKHLPTSFHLEKDQVERLIKAGRRLLKEDPELKVFIEEF